MQQATRQNHAGQMGATATILDFTARGVQAETPIDRPGADVAQPGRSRRDTPRASGLLLGAILLPAAMAIMEILRIIFAG